MSFDQCSFMHTACLSIIYSSWWTTYYIQVLFCKLLFLDALNVLLYGILSLWNLLLSHTDFARVLLKAQKQKPLTLVLKCFPFWCEHCLLLTSHPVLLTDPYIMAHRKHVIFRIQETKWVLGNYTLLGQITTLQSEEKKSYFHFLPNKESHTFSKKKWL